MVAVVIAGALATLTTSVSGRAITGTIEAVSVIRAIPRARVQRAIKSSPSREALAGGIPNTLAMTIAVVGAHTPRAVLSFESGITMTNALVTEAGIGAIVRTGETRAINTAPAARAVASAVEAGTVERTVVRARQGRAVKPTESRITLAGEVNTNTMTRAIARTSVNGAV